MTSNEPSTPTPSSDPLDYDELRRIAGACARGRERERATSLVHRAYVRLAEQRGEPCADRVHFLRRAARVIRHVLIDEARKLRAAKRGGAEKHVAIDRVGAIAAADPSEHPAVQRALEKLARLNARQARVVELRFFEGATLDEIADRVGVSSRTVEQDWRLARAWLRLELESERG